MDLSCLSKFTVMGLKDKFEGLEDSHEHFLDFAITYH